MQLAALMMRSASKKFLKSEATSRSCMHQHHAASWDAPDNLVHACATIPATKEDL